MNLSVSDEQVMLRESAARFVRDWHSGQPRDEKTLWAQFAELGWLALPLAEAHGGLGGSVVDTTVLLEEFGRGPLVTPYVSSIILCGTMVALLGSAAQQDEILGAVATGEQRLAFAHVEAGHRGGARNLTTRAVVDGDGWRLTGTKTAVVDAIGADLFVVSADLDGQVAAFLVRSGSDGVLHTAYPVLGGGSGATLHFDNIKISAKDRLSDGDAGAAIGYAIDAAIVAYCAETVGIMAALLDATVAYANTREQFGKTLSANQSVRFKLADMAVALEEARSLALRAALTLNASNHERVRAVAGAKAGISRRARLVAELAIQLHGAMGVTEELTIGAYYKRVLAIDALFGGIDAQLIRHAAASGRVVGQKVAA